MSAQILPVILDRNLGLGGRDGVDGAVGRDGGGGDGERVIAGQQLNAATVLVNVERFARFSGAFVVASLFIYSKTCAYIKSDFKS